MSFVVMTTFLDEIDPAGGTWADGSPKTVLHHVRGDVFTPKDATRNAVHQAAGNVYTALPALTSASPTHARVGTRIDVIGTDLDKVTAVQLAGNPCHIRAISSTDLMVTTPSAMVPGAYTLTAYMKTFLLPTTLTFTVDP
jgi:hypothetical protein